MVKLEKGQDERPRIYFIESKGEMRNVDDTTYKQKVFNTINRVLTDGIEPKGEFKLADTKEKVSFHMIFENEWENELNALFG